MIAQNNDDFTNMIESGSTGLDPNSVQIARNNSLARPVDNNFHSSIMTRADAIAAPVAPTITSAPVPAPADVNPFMVPAGSVITGISDAGHGNTFVTVAPVADVTSGTSQSATDTTSTQSTNSTTTDISSAPSGNTTGGGGSNATSPDLNDELIKTLTSLFSGAPDTSQDLAPLTTVPATSSDLSTDTTNASTAPNYLHMIVGVVVIALVAWGMYWLYRKYKARNNA